MQDNDTMVFDPGVPPDLEHAPLVREEAIDWIESRFPGVLAFATGAVLRMAGEGSRRWLITRLREHGIGVEEMFSLPAAADALSVLFLRSKGVKFREAVDAVVGGQEASRAGEPRYGGVWNRLLVTALDRLKRRVPPRLLGSALFSLIRDPKDRPNSLIIVKRHGKRADLHSTEVASPVSHDYVYRTILERPPPVCSVIAPSLEVIFLGKDQLPARSELTSRHFVSVHIATAHETYELLMGTMRPAPVSLDDTVHEFVARILDIVFPHFEEFHRVQSASRFETTTEPEAGSADDLQLWLITQFLATVHSGSLCEVIETTQAPSGTRALASSAAKPWEPSLWDPPKGLEMLSGYASLTGVPLVVDKVEQPWTSVIKSVEPEMRYLRSRATDGKGQGDYSALTLPFNSSAGNLMGSLYMLMPGQARPMKDVEVRILTIFSLIVGEIIERQNAARHTANVYVNIATLTILKQEQFKAALLDLLGRMSLEITENGPLRRDMRLPFLLLSANGPDPDELDPAISGRLKDWLVDTLHHLEWRSFVQSHLPDADGDSLLESFVGEYSGVGMIISLSKLVAKDELDRIRSAFTSTINRISPLNSPVKLVAWVLDVPAQRILEAAEAGDLEGLAENVERWALDVATVVDDVAQSSYLAHERGDWDAALRRVRKALQKDGGRTNSYLRRIAADCSFSLGDWPSALKYAQEAAELSVHDQGSGLVRSLCQCGDAHLCLGEPARAWDLYSEAADVAPNHPLPPYYRGQSFLLMARLLQVYENELQKAAQLGSAEAEGIKVVTSTLVDAALDDLTSAADLLDLWGLIPESYQYRNLHLVPTLLGQGLGYLLARSPGPAASRLQSARRSFPKDDLFFREFIFAKCWEGGLHRHYGELLTGDEWLVLKDRLTGAFQAGSQALVPP